MAFQLRPIGVMLRALLLILALSASSAEDEEEGRSALLLYKKMDPPDGYSVGAPINVTLSVFNRGLGDAYSLVVNDDNWKSDKFRIVSGANNFTLDYLNHGDQYVHEFTVVPIKKTWHRVRPAKMAFIDGVEGENTIMHMSNNLPDIRIAVAKDYLEDTLLTVGAVVTLNVIQTKKGWMYAASLLVLFLLVQLFFIAKAVLQKRRHLRALDDLTKK